MINENNGCNANLFLLLRQQVRSLQHKQRKDIDDIARLLKNYSGEDCRQLENNHNRNNERISNSSNNDVLAAATALTMTTDVNPSAITKIDQQYPQAKVGGWDGMVCLVKSVLLRACECIYMK